MMQYKALLHGPADESTNNDRQVVSINVSDGQYPRNLGRKHASTMHVVPLIDWIVVRNQTA